MRRFKPTLWLSFGLVSITLALALVGYVLGLMPDGYKAELNSRAKVAESLAVQIAGAANRQDNATVQETLSSVVERNDDVLSSALRRTNGEIILSAGNHENHWVPAKDGISTPTHVTVPLYGPSGQQGTIELSFGPASTGKRIFGIPATLLAFLAFMLATGFIGYFFILRRTLKQLDPGRVIPERVQKAFDTLNEGVIILDESERILLVNSSFAEMYGPGVGPQIGSKINTLSWRMVDGRAQAGGYPWHTAIREGRETREDFLSLRTVDGEIHNFNVNATVISDEKNKTIGAIVTLRDMTDLKRQKDDFEKTADQLSLAEEQIEYQNNELLYLTSHDALTGCLNRKTFIQQLDAELEGASTNGGMISLLLIDIDKFGQLNSDYGPATGDRVVTTAAEIFRQITSDLGFIGRYSGDQFAITLRGTGAATARQIGENIRTTIQESSRKLLPGDEKISVSIGLAAAEGDGLATQIILSRASQAARVAKSQGRNQLVEWSDGLAVPDQSSSDMLSTSIASAPKANHKISSVSSITIQKPNTNPVVSDQSGFLDGLELSLASAKQSGKQSALIQMTIESFDYLTEALGGKLSETLLRAIRRRVAKGLHQRDEVLVIGNSGEILINVTEIDGKKAVSRIAQHILTEIRKPFLVGDREVFLSCKAGIAVFPNDGGTSAILTRNAGIAMRRARDETTTEGYRFYEAGMVFNSQERLDIEAGIRQALQRNEFELYFQPIINMKSGALAAAESLLRCNNEKLAGIPMDKVIDVAEKSALIGEIDMWVLNTALRQMQLWDESSISLPKISINISATQFTNIEFMDRVYEAIKSIQFSPSRVQIEVTETARMTDVDIAAPQLKRLQQLGALIALDDFGTGQASLTYLQRLHPDVIKIDRSFVTNVHTNHANATLVGAMTVMAHCLGLKVVVEGVEDEDEYNFLRDTKCDEMQGYFISKPMPKSIMSEWMTHFVKERGANQFLENPVEHSDQQDASAQENEPLKVDAA